MEALVATAVNTLANKAIDSMSNSGNSKGRKSRKKELKKEILAEEIDAVSKVQPRTSNPRSKKKKSKNKSMKMKEVSFSNVNAPVQQGTKGLMTHYNRKARSTFKGSESLTVRGCDLIGPVTGTANNYDDIFTLALNPLSVSGSRLAIESQLWMKYRFTNVSLYYVPAVASTTAGQILLSHLGDPETTLPAPRTLAYAQALSSVPGAETSSVWIASRHNFAPSQEDAKEYYIQPDIQGEDRLTVQDVIKICQIVATSATTLGTLYLEYEVIFYAPIININEIISWASIPAIAGSATNAGFFTLRDAGAYVPLSFWGSGGGALTTFTTFALYSTFDFGYMKAFNVYFITTVAAVTTVVNIYANPADSALAATSGKVSGSALGGSIVPPNGTIFYSATSFAPPE